MTISIHQVYLLLGANIQPEKNIPLAVSLLKKQLRVLRISSVWESEAVGSDGPNFLNAVLLAATPLDPETLKTEVLRPLEAKLGRVRSANKYAPRPIDLDILIFDETVIEPNLWNYAFRAAPLAEILPEYLSPEGERLETAAARLIQQTPIWIRKDVPADPVSTEGVITEG